MPETKSAPASLAQYAPKSLASYISDASKGEALYPFVDYAFPNGYGLRLIAVDGYIRMNGMKRMNGSEAMNVTHRTPFGTARAIKEGGAEKVERAAAQIMRFK